MGKPNPLEYFVCGGFGGVCTVLVGHPLDTIKVRLQTMPLPKPGETPIYSGTLDCMKKIIANEGVGGLYKGMGAPLAAIAPIFAVSFMGYSVGKRIFGPPPDEHFTALQYFTSGAFSGIFTTFIMAPGERIKCLLQIQHGSAEKLYNGPLDCAIKLYKQGGIRNVYKGVVATALRDVPASGLYFLTYEKIKDTLTDYGQKEMGMFATIIAGGGAGMSNWMIGMPADVLKSRLQTAPPGAYPNGMKDVFAELLKNEGIFALYKGVAPVLLRAFPANAACFAGFELCKRFLDFLFGKMNS